MADKKLTDLPLQANADDADSLYAVRDVGGVLTDVRVTRAQVAPVKSVNTQTGDVTLGAGDVGAIPESQKGAASGVATLGEDGKVPVTQLPDSGGGSALPLIKIPTVVSPADGETNVGFRGPFIGSPYAPIYSADVRDYREFQIDTVSGDFSSPTVSVQIDADQFSLSEPLDPDQSFQIRIRDISVDGTVSEWSIVSSFTTKAGEVVKPSVVNPVEGETGVRSEIFLSSDFAVSSGSDSFEYSEWELYSSSILVHSSGLVASLTYAFPSGTFATLTEYSVRVRHYGQGYGVSEWSDSVNFTTDTELEFGTYSALSFSNSSSPYNKVYAIDIATVIPLDFDISVDQSASYGSCFSPNGRYLAFSKNSSPYIQIYERSGDAFIRKNDIEVGTSGAGKLVFSPDSSHLYVSLRTNPTGAVAYSIVDGVATLIPFPSIGWSTSDIDCVGDYVVFSAGANRAFIYKKDAQGSFSQLSFTTGYAAASNDTYCCRFSPDSTHLILGTKVSNLIQAYRRNGDTFTKITSPTGNTSPVRAIAFTSDSSYMLVGGQILTSPYSSFITVFQRTGDSYSVVGTISASQSTSMLNQIEILQNNSIVLISQTGSPYATYYQFDSGTLTILPDQQTLSYGTESCALFPSARFGTQA